MQGCPQESGGHNVYRDVMGDLYQAGETAPGLSWVLGQAGAVPRLWRAAVSPLCACSDPGSAVLCTVPLARTPHPRHGLLLASVLGTGSVWSAHGNAFLGVGRLSQGGTGLGWEKSQGCIHLAPGCGSPGAWQSWTACLSCHSRGSGWVVPDGGGRGGGCGLWVQERRGGGSSGKTPPPALCGPSGQPLVLAPGRGASWDPGLRLLLAAGSCLCGDRGAWSPVDAGSSVHPVYPRRGLP